MSDAGKALFNAGASLGGTLAFSTGSISHASHLTVDVVGNINLDSDNGFVTIQDGGTSIGHFSHGGSGLFEIKVLTSDADMKFQGNDGGSAITALTLDMSAAGKATFSASVTAKTTTADSQSGNVTLNFEDNQNFVLTLTGNMTLVNPSTETVGQSGFITLIQDGTGSRTLAVGDQYFGPGGAVPTISTAANSIDIIPYIVIAAGKIALGEAQLAFADAS